MADNKVPVSKEDFQNFDINIAELYQTTFNGIDSIRSNADISKVRKGFSVNSDADNYLHAPANNLNSSTAIGTLRPPSYESRCHAFYRNIGLPIVNPQSPTQFFNPGFNPDLNNDSQKITNYVTICNNFINSDIGAISLDKLEYLLNLNSVFALSDINSSVLTLSSMNIRPFNISLEKNSGEVLNLTSNDQKYIANYTDTNGNDMLTYQGPKGQLPDKLIEFNKNIGRKHLIRPFMTDPRIAFTAKSKSVNIPFLLVPSKYPPCLLETICRQRFAAYKYNNLSDYEQATIAYSKDLKLDIPDLLATNNSDPMKVRMYISFINYARALSKKLKINVTTLKQAQQFFHLLPIPSIYGPVNGISAQNIYFQDPFNTELDQKIIQLNTLNVIENIKISSEQAISRITGKPTELTNRQPIPVFPMSMPDLEGSGNNIKDGLERTVNFRNKTFDAFNKALMNVEYVMGEFTGFGLCDAFVIQFALYLMEKPELYGLLDTEARDRLKTLPEIDPKISDAQVPDVITCLKALENKVSSLYQVFQQIYDQSGT